MCVCVCLSFGVPVRSDGMHCCLTTAEERNIHVALIIVTVAIQMVDNFVSDASEPKRDSREKDNLNGAARRRFFFSLSFANNLWCRERARAHPIIVEFCFLFRFGKSIRFDLLLILCTMEQTNSTMEWSEPEQTESKKNRTKSNIAYRSHTDQT